MMLAEFFARLYQPRRLLGRSPETVRRYENTLGHFKRFLKRLPRVSDLNEDTISDFAAWFAALPVGKYRPTDRKPATINKAITNLVALAKYAHAKRLLGEVPDVRTVPDYRRAPAPGYTQDEMERLLAACWGRRGDVAGIPAGRYWLALTLILYYSGARPGVVWSLSMGHVDLNRETVFLPAEHQKQRVDQVLRIGPDAVSAVRAILKPPRDRLFPWSLNPSMRYYHWHRILQSAGLPVVHRDQFRKLRRTCATLCHVNGADATAQLGHSSDAVTRRHYLTDTGPQAADVIPRLRLPSDDPQRRLF